MAQRWRRRLGEAAGGRCTRKRWKKQSDPKTHKYSVAYDKGEEDGEDDNSEDGDDRDDTGDNKKDVVDDGYGYDYV